MNATASASAVRLDLPAAALALDRRFRRDGFTPIGLALVSDLNAVAEAGCPACDRRGTVEALPYWGDGSRLLCLCHACDHASEG